MVAAGHNTHNNNYIVTIKCNKHACRIIPGGWRGGSCVNRPQLAPREEPHPGLAVEEHVALETAFRTERFQQNIIDEKGKRCNPGLSSDIPN